MSNPASVAGATTHPAWLASGAKLANVLELDPDVLPVYVGDDETDEDAFRAVRDRGLGVVVRGEGDDRPTLARYTLRDSVETRAFVELLIDALSEQAPS